MKTWTAAILLSVVAAASSGPAHAGSKGSPKPLELGACAVAGLPADARCGTFEVFENRAARKGRKIALRIAVIPATGAAKLSDPVVFFAGGPGQSSVEAGGFLAHALPQLRDRRDILLVDFRGTGGSAPLTCPELQGSAGVQGFLDEFMPPDKVRACRDRLRETADLSRYTTDAAVDDVDDVRAALGYDRLNLIGGSYGTRAALVYMRRHPDRVRTATLQGVVPTFARMPLDAARNTQHALDGLVSECAQDAACAAAFPKLRDEIDAVLAASAKEPGRATLADPRTGKPFGVALARNGVAQTLRYMLYLPASAAQLPMAVHRAAAGDYKPLADVARLFAETASSLSDGFFLSVVCAEDVAFIDDDEIQPAVAGTFFGDFRIRQQRAACDGWPAARVRKSFLDPVVSDAPVLLISGERDPATPASDGEAVARTLRRGKHVIVPDGGHDTEGMGGLACLDGLTTKLIESGATDGLDTACVSGMKRPAFVVREPEPEVRLARADLEPLAGTYQGEGGLTIVIDLVEDRLRATVGGKSILLVPASPARFRLEGLPEGYALVFDRGDGPAAAVTFELPGEPAVKATRK